jgi:hypothetical protein
MKNVALLALMLSLGVFTVGCEKKKETPKADAVAPAAAPADAAPAGDADKKE